LSTYGYRYARNEYISRGISRKYDPKSLKRTMWNNTMTYVDEEGHRWFRLCTQDIIKMDASGKFAQIFWEDGWIASLTPTRISEILCHIWGRRKWSFNFQELNHQDIEITIDTGVPDFENKSISGCVNSIRMHYKGHRGMVIPKNGLPSLQGFQDTWRMKSKLQDWASAVFKHGIRKQIGKAKTKMQKWDKQASCPDCARELEMYNQAWGMSDIDIDCPDSIRRLVVKDVEVLHKVDNQLLWWKAKPYGVVPNGELPFSHYDQDKTWESCFNHHLFKHIEAEEYPPELLAAAIRSSNNPDLIEYSNDPLFGRKFRFKTTNTGYVRWLLRAYLIDRIGLPVYRI